MKKRISFYSFLLALGFTVFSGCEPVGTLTAVPYDLPVVSPEIPVIPHTIVVTSAEDSGEGTLREALEIAQSFERITFNISEFSPDNPKRIVLQTSLPPLSKGNQMIDASNAGVILDGSSIVSEEPVNGLDIASDHNTIRGLYITGFSNAGIGLDGGAQYNLIGGDRSIGAGPFGQGNFISGNASFGIGLWDANTSHNTIQGNFIGVVDDCTQEWGHTRDGIHSNGATNNLITDNVIGQNQQAGVYLCCAVNGANIVKKNHIGVGLNGEALGNSLAGVLIDRSSNNMVGSNNTIAYNLGDGVLFWADAAGNTITNNSIHNNNGNGVVYSNPGFFPITPPLIFSFNLIVGQLSGWAEANSNVEIYSDAENEGENFEGNVMADSQGYFEFNKGSAFIGPHVTATATNTNGSTSGFSSSASCVDSYLILQEGNQNTRRPIITKTSNELIDNKIGGDYGELKEGIRDGFFSLGLKWARVAFDGGGSNLNWQRVEQAPGVYVVDPVEDGAIKTLHDNGVNVILNLGVGPGDGIEGIRFATEDEIERYINYVVFMVDHFDDWVEYFELWNEPGGVDYSTGIPSNIGINVDSYEKVIFRTIEAVHEEGLEAKFIIGALGGDWIYPYQGYGDYARSLLHKNYLRDLIATGIVSEVDGISWHPFYGDLPGDPYYQTYPEFVDEIKSLAASEGFNGVYFAEEIKYYSKPNNEGWGRSAPVETEKVAVKYYARAIVMHRGLDFTVSTAGQMPYSDKVSDLIRILCTVMDTANPMTLPVNVQSNADNLQMYAFSLQDDSRMVALWTNVEAIDDDPGVNAQFEISSADVDEYIGFLPERVIAIDVLNGFEQDLIVQIQNGNLIISDLLIKDYPIILHFVE